MLKIISGGQTGVDRAALDVALAQHIACGGWCPQGRRAEDGVIPDRYPLVELTGGGYRERTRKNVQNSDATVIVYFACLQGGTRLTWQFCIAEGKPFLLIDGNATAAGQAAWQLYEFVRQLPDQTVNFAGPRASAEARSYSYSVDLVAEFVRLYNADIGAL